jgi:hypothetical protein
MRASAKSLSVEKRGHSSEYAQHAPQTWQSEDTSNDAVPIKR